MNTHRLPKYLSGKICETINNSAEHCPIVLKYDNLVHYWSRGLGIIVKIHFR